MSCENVLFIKFAECDNSFTFPIALVPNTDYAYLLTDKFGNKYKDTFTSNSDGSLTINRSDFQEFTFTSASGNFTLSIKEHINSCNNINFVYCDAEFDSITFSFSKNNLNLMPTCEIIRTCLGISDNGSESSFLNEKGEFKTYQEILSNLPSYSIQQDAIDDGNPNGFWYYNTTTKSISKIGVEITSYTAGTSTIDFTNNGGDDWTVGFFINPTSLQAPSGVTVASMDLTISHWVAGVENNLDNQLINTDYPYNATGNGAGVYALFAHYNLSDGSEFQVYRLVKVDGSGNILISLEVRGIVVNSVNGLNMNVTASVIQTGASYNVLWVELPSNTQVGTGTTTDVTLSSNTTSLAFTLDVDSAITTDMTNPFGATSTISIN